MICWRCQVRHVARSRLKPWKRIALCRPCADEVNGELLKFAVIVFLVRGLR